MAALRVQVVIFLTITVLKTGADTLDVSKESILQGSDQAIVCTLLGKMDYRQVSIRNKQTYAITHRYDLLLFERPLSAGYLNDSKEMMFNKPLAIRRVLNTEKYHWVWWLDADSLIMNHRIRFENLLPIPSSSHADLIQLVFGGDLLAILNAGSMIFRNSTWTLSLLDQIYKRRADNSVPNVDSWHEQAVLLHLYMNDPDVREHTLVLPQRSLNSYTHNYQPGDFVIHFAGAGADKSILMAKYAAGERALKLE